MNKIIGILIFIIALGMSFATYHFPCTHGINGGCAHGQVQNVDATIFVFLFVFFALHIYMLPTIIANLRHNPYAATIFWGNLMFGWTFLGWCASIMAAVAPLNDQ